jgi:streptogramin lyase
MGWILPALKSLHRPSRNARRMPKRNRSLSVENLEVRGLLSHAMPSLVTLPDVASNMVDGPGGDLWVAVNPPFGNVNVTIDRIALNGSITSFTIPGNTVLLSQLVDGYDGELWFAVSTSTSSANATVALDRISVTGSIASFPLPGVDNSVSLVTGPDGNVWFASDPGNTVPNMVVGNVTPAGQVTEIPVGGQSDFLNGLVSGPAGDVWFGVNGLSAAHQPVSEIGQATPAGPVKLFPLAGDSLDSIAAGPDGNLWFTATIGKRNWRSVVGRMTPSGGVTLFPIPIHDGVPEVVNGPSGRLVVAATDGAGTNEIFRVSTSGAVRRDQIPAAMNQAFYNYLGSAAGSIWFSDDPGSTVGQITANGMARTYNLPSSAHRNNNSVSALTVGQDGDVYVIDSLISRRDNDATVYRIWPR